MTSSQTYDANDLIQAVAQILASEGLTPEQVETPEQRQLRTSGACRLLAGFGIQGTVHAPEAAAAFDLDGSLHYDRKMHRD